MKRTFTALLSMLLGASALSGQQPAARVINIVAERFSFTPARITVEQGTTVELRITSEDTSHGFKLTGPDTIDVEIPKRGRGDRRVLFTASEPGTYTFECSRVCGAGHGFMRGAIQVKPRQTDGGRP